MRFSVAPRLFRSRTPRVSRAASGAGKRTRGRISAFSLLLTGWLAGTGWLVGPLVAEQPIATTRWVGVVLPLEAIDVAVEAPGRLEAVRVRAGARVEAGEILARLDARTAASNERIASAELEMAEAELERSRARSRQESSRYARRSTTAELWSEEELASTEAEARSAEAETRAATARVEKARAEVRQLRQVLDRLEVRAPFAGRVAIRYLDPGAVVAAGSPIARLVSDRALLVRFAVPPEEVTRLEEGDWVSVAETSAERIGRARIRRISPEIDLASQRVFVEAILESETLRRAPKGGLGVDVRLEPARASSPDEPAPVDGP